MGGRKRWHLDNLSSLSVTVLRGGSTDKSKRVVVTNDEKDRKLSGCDLAHGDVVFVSDGAYGLRIEIVKE